MPEIPKGIYTGPSKKGTFGYNKTTLSERQGYKGVVTEYEYHADPETLHTQKRREAQEADRKARVAEVPFRPANPPKKGKGRLLPVGIFSIPNFEIAIAHPLFN